MNLSFLGGAAEVGGSSIYIRTDTANVLLDAGIRQSAQKDPIPDYQAVKDGGGIDCIFISHAHMDHIGTLPMISGAYPDAKIYMTVMTMELTRVLLYDSLKLMEKREEDIPIYTEAEVQAMLKRIVPVHYQVPVRVTETLTVTFYPAGHIAGAACLYLETEEGTIFYSGDFSSFSQQTIEGLRVPRLRPDVAIYESTYGNRLHANRQAEEQRLVDLVSRCIKEGKKVLIPCFALGRSQEVLLLLRQAMQKGQLDKVPVYVDGMIRDIVTIYQRNPTYLKNALARRIWKDGQVFYSDEIQPVSRMQNREDLVNKPGSAIFVSSSGMLCGGPSSTYARLLAPKEDSCIILTGYQDEEAPGRMLMNLLESAPEERKLTMDGTTFPVRCEIHQVGLSAHGDKNEITSLAQMLSSRNIFLVHGDTDAISELGTALSQDFRNHVYQPVSGETMEVSIRNKRKQAGTVLTSSLCRGIDTPPDGETLWQFCAKEYPGKSFTVYDLCYLWTGKRTSDEEALDAMQQFLLSSPLFEVNSRRTFLFLPVSEEERTKQKNRPVTSQEVEAAVAGIFKDIPYRKLGFFTERKTVRLTVDFPDVIDPEKFREGSSRLEEQTGWTAELGGTINTQAANQLLFDYFGNRVLKTSVFLATKTFLISLNAQTEDDLAYSEPFLKTTGWTLTFKNSGSDGGAMKAAASSFEFRPISPADPVEQNLAFSCIDSAFSELEAAPYKKGLKNDSNGKYIELSFKTPQIGLRMASVLTELSDRIGWRLRIADSVNQQEIFLDALALCKNYGIVPKKNPAYHPAEKCIRIKTAEPVAPDLSAAVKEDFLSLTGLPLELI